MSNGLGTQNIRLRLFFLYTLVKVLSARWAYMTNILCACKRRTCLQMLAVITRQVNCQKGRKLRKDGKRDISVVASKQCLTNNLEVKSFQIPFVCVVILAHYFSVSLVSICFHSLSPDLWGDNDGLMIVAQQLSCLGCCCAMIGTEDRAEITWEMDWTGKKVWCLILLYSSLCSLLSVQSQVSMDAPLIGTLKAGTHCCGF